MDDYVTHGKSTTGETVNIEDVDADRLKEKLLEAGMSESRAEAKAQGVRDRQ